MIYLNCAVSLTLLFPNETRCRQAAGSDVPSGWALRSAVAIRKLPVDGDGAVIPKDERTELMGWGCPGEAEGAVHIIIWFLSFLFIIENNDESGQVGGWVGGWVGDVAVNSVGCRCVQGKKKERKGSKRNCPYMKKPRVVVCV
jgi:hypothetical protein